MSETGQLSQPKRTPAARSNNFGRVLTHPYLPVLVLIGINLLIGLVVVSDFGESWDEQLRYRYADRSLAAYFGDLRGLQDEKGPFYVMLARLGSDLIMRFFPGWQSIDAWHFMHFLAFQVAIFCLYDLALRFLSKPAALASALLFSTQPILWGHAFINPKDIPFMAFFIASVALGVHLAEELTKRGVPDWKVVPLLAAPGIHSNLRQDYARDSRSRLFRVLIVGVWVVPFILLLLRPIILSWLGNVITSAYHGEAAGWVNELFHRFAQNADTVPLESYLSKLFALYPLVVIGSVFLAIMVGFVLAIRLFPKTLKFIWASFIRPSGRVYLQAFKIPILLGAGFILGVTTSIRVLGPFAGVLVGGYILIRRGWRSLPVLMSYASVAILTAYLTWPALWGAPLRAFSTSFQMASDFDWQGKVLFAGEEYASGSLPPSYMPTLLTLQLTEFTLLLAIIGFFLFVYHVLNNKQQGLWFGILTAWFFVPVLGVIVVQPNIYDNFRHFLFVLPPVFLFGGFALDWGMHFLRRRWLQAALIALVVLPNMYWLVNLHPYSYIYYNSLAGGLSGAFRRYEADYWATSYREAANFINHTAPVDAAVLVWGPDHIVARFARPDLQIYDFRRFDPARYDEIDYAVISTRHNKDLTLFPEANVVFQVGREGALFSVVKQLNSDFP